MDERAQVGASHHSCARLCVAVSGRRVSFGFSRVPHTLRIFFGGLWRDVVQDLAPGIHRQRLVMEGIPTVAISDGDIKDYLSKLSEVLSMRTLQDPVTNHSSRYGWAGWIHWESSGAHFYAWELPQLFFSVDVYTCSPFEASDAVEFTREFFAIEDVQHLGF